MEKNLIPSLSVVSTASNSSSEDGRSSRTSGQMPNLSPTSEDSLIPPNSVNSDPDVNNQDTLDSVNEESSIYELIGVTVHTGTAEGGHYYSFIRERNALNELDDDENTTAKWYLMLFFFHL